MVTPTLTLSQPLVLGTYGLLGKWILFKQKKNPVSRIIILSNPHFAQVFLRIDISLKVAKCSAQCQVQRSFLFSLKQKGFKYLLPDPLQKKFADLCLSIPQTSRMVQGICLWPRCVLGIVSWSRNFLFSWCWFLPPTSLLLHPTSLYFY